MVYHFASKKTTLLQFHKNLCINAYRHQFPFAQIFKINSRKKYRFLFSERARINNKPHLLKNDYHFNKLGEKKQIPIKFYADDVFYVLYRYFVYSKSFLFFIIKLSINQKYTFIYIYIKMFLLKLFFEVQLEHVSLSIFVYQ